MMKKNLVVALVSLSFAFGLFSFVDQRQLSAAGRTEEYAVISVFQSGRNNYLSVTVGSKPSVEREYQKDKNEIRYDLAPVLAEVEKLNAQGFELVNGSAAIHGMNQYGGGAPFYSFIMKRRLP
ncbi:hypothetical protein FY528_12150 [Hymenobacter lutimineralis]|uniref:DUF541 domain-containing protein n=2 Tax=Hymenobacter lutimineralis TaxID=2606448 RepID=A0A5D6UYI7_9BACT|nr:hypothetical protein FY528_12150 [Hymenobacter lutimineralis]